MPVATAAEELNGDLPLTGVQRSAYMQFHVARNRSNTQGSAQVNSRAGMRPSHFSGMVPPSVPRVSTPSRASSIEFFACAAHLLAPRWRGRSITVVDIGAGCGRQLDCLIAMGLSGHCIAVDIARHPRWQDGPRGGFSRQLVLQDVNTIDAGTFPTIDLILSNTALEHIRDDVGAIAAVSQRLHPEGCQVHFVPGEASLALYGPHGYRQYSPACLSALFPCGEIHRYGGAASNELHAQWISPATMHGVDRRDEDPEKYAHLRELAMDEDEIDGHTPAAMYGVLVSL